MFFPEVIGLENNAAVKGIQEQALLMLSDYSNAAGSFPTGPFPFLTLLPPESSTNKPKSMQGRLRYAKLIFLLPSVWAISEKSVKTLFFNNSNAKIDFSE